VVSEPKVIWAWLSSIELNEYTSGTMIKLSASNYSIWKSMMEDVLYCKDLHDLIEGDSAKPSSMPDKEWAKMHRKTIGCIRQCIEVSVFHHVSQETKADTLWKKL
jgi:hypothetical protein